MTTLRPRVAAYGICVDGDEILLARFISRERHERHWTLPGGRVEHGEDPVDAVVREVAEETGYVVEVDRLLGVDSRTKRVDDGAPGGLELHHVGVVYTVRITGGEIRHEVNGSTDLAAWFPLARVPEVERSVVVDVALGLEQERPANGHVEPLTVGGLLRH